MTMDFKNTTPVKKVRQWLHETAKKQEQQPAYSRQKSTAVRTCAFCGETFEGRYCPQCGTDNERTALTFRNALQNVLDVWGLGNRPMWRTIKELFWRPGYMMRDYLRGRQMAYFPPVKMLFLLAMFLLLEANLLGISITPDVNLEMGEGAREETPAMVLQAQKDIMALGRSFVDWVFSHPAQMTIIECLVIIFLIARFFRNSPGFGSITRTESFFVQIYYECQVFCVMILAMPLYALASSKGQANIADLVSAVTPVTILIYICDFRQLFRFSLWQTIWRVAKLYLTLYALLLILALLIGIGIGFFLMSVANQ